MDRAKLREELIRDEGLRLKAYKDSVGLYTIGVGHLMPVTAIGVESITHEQAMDILERDIDIAYSLAAEVFKPWEDIDDARQRALVNMVFNLGGRIRGFVNFIAAVRGRDWPIASIEMMDSRWARQVGERATRLRSMILFGDEA